MSKRWQVVDQDGTVWDTRAAGHWVAAIAVCIAVIMVGEALGWPWWFAVLVGGLWGQTTRNALANRRHNRIATDLAKTHADKVAAAEAKAIREDPDRVAVIERAERVAQLRTSVEAGVPFVDYATGTVWPLAEAAELLRVEERRAQHVAEIAEQRKVIAHAEEQMRRPTTTREAREAYERRNQAQTRIAAVQWEIDRIDGKPVDAEPKPARDEQEVITWLREHAEQHPHGAEEAMKAITAMLADLAKIERTPPMQIGNARTPDPRGYPHHRDHIHWPELAPPSSDTEERQAHREVVVTGDDAEMDMPPAEVVGVDASRAGVGRLVRFSDGHAMRLTTGDMAALIQDGPDVDPRWAFVLPSGQWIAAGRSAMYAVELAELLRTEARR